MSRIVLPDPVEGQTISPALYAAAAGVDRDRLTLGPSADALITFRGEMAGNRNILGVYLIESDGSIREPRIVFDDSENVTSRTVALRNLYGPGELEEGQEIGLFVIGDGADLNPSQMFQGSGSFAFVNTNGTPATLASTTPRLIYTDENGQATTVRGEIFHATDGGSPDPASNTLNPLGGGQVISGNTTGGDLELRFDDRPVGSQNQGWSDRDFNDLMIEVDTNPPPDVPGDATSTAAVAEGFAVVSNIDSSGDEDWFQADLVADRLYRVDLEQEDGDGTPLSDPFLTVYDENGEFVAFNDNTVQSINSQLFFRVSETGSYFLSAKDAANGTGDYRLSFREVDLSDDVPAGVSTDETLPVGFPVLGTIDVPGDTDWYRVDLQGGDGNTYRYTFNMVADPASTELPLDSALQLFDASGNGVKGEDSDPRFDFDSFLTFETTTGGTFYISAEGFSNNIGDYILSVEEEIVDPFMAMV